MHAVSLALLICNAFLTIGVLVYACWVYSRLPQELVHYQCVNLCSAVGGFIALAVGLPLWEEFSKSTLEDLFVKIILAEYLYFYAISTVLAMFWLPGRWLKLLGLVVTLILCFAYIMI